MTEGWNRLWQLQSSGKQHILDFIEIPAIRQVGCFSITYSFHYTFMLFSKTWIFILPNQPLVKIHLSRFLAANQVNFLYIDLFIRYFTNTINNNFSNFTIILINLITFWQTTQFNTLIHIIHWQTNFFYRLMKINFCTELPAI